MTPRGLNRLTCANSPKLHKLKEILLSHFRHQSPHGDTGAGKSTSEESRAIVFVALRSTVHDIVAELNHSSGRTRGVEIL